MPKRIIDGDSLWVSEKLSTVPERYRVEYAWILPLAQVNGCFECSPMLVWRTCYSALRTDWRQEDVAVMLDEFEKAKMLFRWKVDGKTFGFFIGAQKEGRLPSPSDRVRSAKPWQTGMIPEKQLASFLGVPVKKVRESFRELLATSPRRVHGDSEEVPSTGIGTGVGAGTGSGTGTEVGRGKGNGTGTATGSGAAKLPTQDDITGESSLLNSTTPEPNETSTPSTIPSNAGDFARLFHRLIQANPHATDTPHQAPPYWTSDFATLLKAVSPSDLFDMVLISQIEKNQKFYIRPKSLVDNYPLLKDMVRERSKALPALRAKALLLGNDWDDDDDELDWEPLPIQR